MFHFKVDIQKKFAISEKQCEIINIFLLQQYLVKIFFCFVEKIKVMSDSRLAL